MGAPIEFFLAAAVGLLGAVTLRQGFRPDEGIKLIFGLLYLCAALWYALRGWRKTWRETAKHMDETTVTNGGQDDE